MTNQNVTFSKNFLILSFIYLLSILATTISANYFFQIYNFNFAGGIFIFPLSFLIGTVIGEVYNYSYQRFVIIISVSIQMIFVFYIRLFISLRPAAFFHNQPAYQTVFGSDMRYFIFAVIGLYFSELINVYLLTRWKAVSKGRGYFYRAFFCIILSQLGLSLIVNLGAFLGKTNNIEQLVNLTSSNYIMKVILTAVALPFCCMLVNKLRMDENRFYFDVKTKFSPFSIKIDNIYREIDSENK